MRDRYFPQICEPVNLMNAWLQVREIAGAAFGDYSLVAEYDQHLENNLYDLAARLAQGGYRPPFIAAHGRPLGTGQSRNVKFRLIEDLIVQQAARRVLEEVYEPEFLDCSFGFRPWRNTRTAVSRVLEHRARGDFYVMLSGVHFGFDSLEHEAVIRAVAARISDDRMLNLIRSWLSCGLLRYPDAPKAEASRAAGAFTQLSQLAPEPLRAAISQLKENRENHHGPTTGWNDDRSYEGKDDWHDGEADKFRRMLKDIAAQFGRDALLVGVTSLLTAKSLGDSPRELLKPKQVALTAATLLAMAAYPQASRMLREKTGAGDSLSGASLPSPMAPLLLNVLLHNFDLALSAAGWHLVRYAGSFAITAHSEPVAQSAYQTAARQLRQMQLPLDPQTSRIKRFDQGVEFLGYRFHDHMIAATPVANEHEIFDELLDQASTFLRSAPGRISPEATQLGARAKEHVTAGLRRIKSLITRSRI